MGSGHGEEIGLLSSFVELPLLFLLLRFSFFWVSVRLVPGSVSLPLSVQDACRKLGVRREDSYD